MTGRIRGLLAVLLALAMALGLAPGAALAEEAGLGPQAGGKEVACLGTSGIAVAQDGKWVEGGGSYVCYGKYDGSPTRYRVLSNKEGAMLLDCDSILYTAPFDESASASNVWMASSLRDTLNGDDWLGNRFTTVERGAILTTSITESEKTTEDKVFLLGVADVDGGYYAAGNDSDAAMAARKKSGGGGFWWLRTAGTFPSDPCAAVVGGGGSVFSLGLSVDRVGIGVSPAFNIDLKSVILSSLISGVAGQSGAEYKLTITDATLAASGTAALDGTTATVTYATTGDAATQASYLVTDKAWSDSDGWPADAQVLAYGRLGDAGEGKSGTFELPGGCAADGWGTDYHVYVLAESLGEGNATDYAGAPVEVAKPEQVKTPTFDPAGGAYASGQSVTIGCATEGATVRYTTDGTEPTEGSAAYAGPIAVSTSTTIKAIATKEGMLDSEVAEARYEIAVPVATYKINVAQATGGTVSADRSEAAEGATVGVTATPAKGYELEAVTVDGEAIAGNTFEMPARDVTVSARFRKPEPTPEPEPTPAATVAKASKPKTVAYVSKGEVAVSWKAAKGAKSYQLQWRKAGAKKWTTKTVKGKSRTVTGLEYGALYEFRVRGVNGKVRGKWSAASLRWLKGAAKAKAAAGKAKGAVKATWKADKAATGGFKVFVYSKRGGKAVKTKVVKAGSTSATVKGLKSGKTYYVRVRPYRTQGGSTYYGAISGYRSVKAK